MTSCLGVKAPIGARSQTISSAIANSEKQCDVTTFVTAPPRQGKALVKRLRKYVSKVAPTICRIMPAAAFLWLNLPANLYRLYLVMGNCLMR